MTCSIPDCPNIAERSGKCATHARLERKAQQLESKPVKAHKPINKMSDKMKAALAEYNRLRKQFLEANPKCAVYPEKPSTQVHHMAGRNTIELLLDTDKWLAVSFEGHSRIELNPSWAKQMGYSLSRLADEPYRI